MTTITLVSVDSVARTATFAVNGQNITRGISQEVTSETLADHLQALANGLIIEAEAAAVEVAEVTPLSTDNIQVNTEYSYVEPVVEEAPVETPVTQ